VSARAYIKDLSDLLATFSGPILLINSNKTTSFDK